MGESFWIFVQQLINGMTLGATYAVVAVGYTLVFGVLGVVNLAHGDIMMMGAMAGWLAARVVGPNFGAVILAAMLTSGALGLAMERAAIRPLSRAHALAPMISTIGVSIFLQSLAARLFGPYRLSFPPVLPGYLLTVGPLVFTSTNLVVLGVSVLVMVALKFLVDRTPAGRAIRAKAGDVEVASFLGVNTGWVNAMTVGLASGLAGAAGVLLGLTFGVVSPYIGIPYGLKGLVILVIGGLGRLDGAVVGGLMLGVIEALTVGYLSSAYRDAVAFLVLLAVLLVRPQGLFGSQAAVEART